MIAKRWSPTNLSWQKSPKWIWPWTTDLPSNRGHLPIDVCQHTKFEVCGSQKHFPVIGCTSCWRLTYQTTNICKAICSNIRQKHQRRLIATAHWSWQKHLEPVVGFSLQYIVIYDIEFWQRELILHQIYIVTSIFISNIIIFTQPLPSG